MRYAKYISSVYVDRNAFALYQYSSFFFYHTRMTQRRVPRWQHGQVFQTPPPLLVFIFPSKLSENVCLYPKSSFATFRRSSVVPCVPSTWRFEMESYFIKTYNIRILVISYIYLHIFEDLETIKRLYCLYCCKYAIHYFSSMAW